MNTLSWLIYLADVAGSLNWALGMTCLVALIAIPVWTTRNKWLEDFEDGIGVVATPVFRLLVVSGVAAFLGVLVPSSNTIYAIAASEMGEETLNTETGGKAVQALNAWLDRQIEGEKDGE